MYYKFVYNTIKCLSVSISAYLTNIERLLVYKLNMERNRTSNIKISNIYIQGITAELKLYSLSNLHFKD